MKKEDFHPQQNKKTAYFDNDQNYQEILSSSDTIVHLHQNRNLY